MFASVVYSDFCVHWFKETSHKVHVKNTIVNTQRNIVIANVVQKRNNIDKLKLYCHLMAYLFEFKILTQAVAKNSACGKTDEENSMGVNTIML